MIFACKMRIKIRTAEEMKEWLHTIGYHALIAVVMMISTNRGVNFVSVLMNFGEHPSQNKVEHG